MPRHPASGPSVIEAHDLHALACPLCHGSLALEPAAVRCIGCTRAYPIIDGIPVLLAAHASLDLRLCS